MYVTNSNNDIIAEYRKKFLFLDRSATTPLNLAEWKNKYTIYVIENITNHKIYIGRATNLLNRSNQYIRCYRNYLNSLNLQSNGKHSSTREIIAAICNEGIQNFIMYPIAIANSRTALSELEMYYIEYYDSTNPDKGYNVSHGDNNNKPYKSGGRGHPHTIESKINRSKIVVCINPSTRDMIISVGMKLFGDYTRVTKDIIKNAARKPYKHNGYYVIYLSNVDRRTIESNYSQRRIKYQKASANNDKSYRLARFRNNYDEYEDIVKLVDIFASEKSLSVFTEQGYTCRFLSYEIDPNVESTYKFDDINIFMEIFKNE